VETGALGEFALNSAAGFCLVNHCFRRNWQEVPLMWGYPVTAASYSFFSELGKTCFLQPCIY